MTNQYNSRKLTEIFDELNTPSTSGQILVEAPAIILPKQIVPIPKAKRENKVKRRKSKKSEVVTSSPLNKHWKIKKNAPSKKKGFC